MKRIYKIVRQIMSLCVHAEYRIIVTENHIEVKLRGNKNVDEINFSVKHTKEQKLFLLVSLEAEFRKIKEKQL